MKNSPILDEYGNNMRASVKVERPMRLHAKFDAAQTTPDNRNHWSFADSDSPNRAVSPRIRQVLRKRSRYEVANNSFLKGMIETKVNFTLGRGPRLQMMLPDQTRNRDIENAWKRHCRLIKFCPKVRTAYRAKLVDGEGVGEIRNNRRLVGRTPSIIDLKLYECEHLSDPILQEGFDDDRYVDGLRLDTHRDPIRYHLLHNHPGGNQTSYGSRRGRWLPPERVVHMYREDRPGQRRGIPYTTPSLPLFAIMRRYTLAALHTSEWAAELNGVMFSNATLQPEDPAEIDALLEIPWARNSLLTLPFGWDLKQIKSEQPTTTFSEFYKQVLNEAARCLDMPFNVAAGNSAEYNMASGRLDTRVFTKSNEIERADVEDTLIDPFFEEWLKEYLAVKAEIAPSDVDLADYPHIWAYDAFDEDDPLKVANAQIALFNAGLSVDEDYWISQNRDPQEQREKLKKSIEWRSDNGAPLPGVVLQQVSNGSGGSGSNSESNSVPESDSESEPATSERNTDE